MGLPLQKSFKDSKPHILIPALKHKAITTALNKSLRYPLVVGEDWKTLPQSIQTRFIKWRPNRTVTLYQGRVLETRFNLAGRLLSLLSGLFGQPLPRLDVSRGPATVIVRETTGYEGQIWTRIYPRENNPPQVIQTIKKFSGKTGLEEMITPNIGIGLRVKVSKGQLLFQSDNYFISLFGKKLIVPALLTPEMKITHKEAGLKRFRFTLEIKHPFLGEMIYQTALFEEVEND